MNIEEMHTIYDDNDVDWYIAKDIMSVLQFMVDKYEQEMVIDTIKRGLLKRVPASLLKKMIFYDTDNGITTTFEKQLVIVNKVFNKDGKNANYFASTAC